MIKNITNQILGCLFGCAFICVFAQSGYTQKLSSKHIFGTTNARQIGPATMSGRITCIDAVGSTAEIIYTGTGGGGVWKSNNSGTSFQSVFDAHCQSIGAIAIDPKHHDTVWVGSGESWMRNSISSGDGVYKTTNGGKTWQNVGLPESHHISKICISPKNTDIVYVAVTGKLWGDCPERGVFKTADGGKTWSKVLYINEQTGIADLAINPKNPNIIYAAAWQFRRSAYSFSSGGKSSNLYKSTDAGKTWKIVSGPWKDQKLGRIALAISPVNADKVYALVESEQTALYRSDDEGKNWKKVNSTKVIGERPFYFSLLVPDPILENRIYKPGYFVNISENSGKYFEPAAISGGKYHMDCHALWINPANNKHLILGTDGGIYISLDKGNTWRFVRSLPVSQFYHVSIDTTLNKITPSKYNVYGGLQDNGSWYGVSNSLYGIMSKDWHSIGFGDGFYVHQDSKDPNYLYWQYQAGNIQWFNKQTREFKSIVPVPENINEKLRFHWNTPLIFSQDGERMYIGTQFVHLSKDRGESWIKISPDLTTNNPEFLRQDLSGGITIDNTGAENHCTVFTINESPLDSKIIWAGTDDGNLQVTKNAGKTWFNIVGNIPKLPSSAWCSSICPSQHDMETAYATFDCHRNNDFRPYVFKTTDLGRTWEELSDSTISSFCNKIIEDPVSQKMLYLGTEQGLYISLDYGENWIRYEKNFPKVSVRDLCIHPHTNDLVAGTHGRGVIIIDDISPLRQIDSSLFKKEIFIFQPQPYYAEGVQSMKYSTGDDEFVGKGKPDALIIKYFLGKRHIFGEMKIEILDASENKIATLIPTCSKGINQVEWIPRMPPPDVPISPQLAGFALLGPVYPAGKYKVKLTKNKKEFFSEVEILQAGNATADEIELRHKIILRIYEQLEDLASVDKSLLNIRKKTTVIKSKLNAKMQVGVDAISSHVDSLRAEIAPQKSGALFGEIKLRERIAYTYGMISIYNGKPSKSQIQSVDIFDNEIKKLKEQLKFIENKMIPRQNKLLRKNNFPQIVD